MDADCASKLACFGGECKNPCFETKPCGKNAECLVVDSLPLRTMSCLCLPGFVGDADTECKLGKDFVLKVYFSDHCHNTYLLSLIILMFQEYHLKNVLIFSLFSLRITATHYIFKFLMCAFMECKSGICNVPFLPVFSLLMYSYPSMKCTYYSCLRVHIQKISSFFIIKQQWNCTYQLLQEGNQNKTCFLPNSATRTARLQEQQRMCYYRNLP